MEKKERVKQLKQFPKEKLIEFLLKKEQNFLELNKKMKKVVGNKKYEDVETRIEGLNEQLEQKDKALKKLKTDDWVINQKRIYFVLNYLILNDLLSIRQFIVIMNHYYHHIKNFAIAKRKLDVNLVGIESVVNKYKQEIELLK